MANLKTVQIPAEVKLQVTNQAQVMRNLYKDFQDIFASVDPGSTFGKSIAKAFSKVENKLSASEGLLNNEFFSEADLQKVAFQLSSISELFGQINIQARGVSANTLGLDTTEIENAEKHLKQLQERVRELKGVKVGTLLGADSKDLQEFAKLSKTTGFSGGKSYTENYKSMETAVGSITEKYGQLTIEAQEAEEALRQANEETAKARVSLNMAEGQLANRKQANMNVASQIMGVKVSGKGATRDSITEQYLSMLDAQLDQEQWVAGGENFAHIIAGWLKVDEADLAGTATDIVNNLKNAIRTAMAGGPIASNKLRASAKSVLGGEEAALRKDAGYVELEQKAQTSATYVQGAEIAAAEALSTLQAANNNVEQTRQLLEEIQAQMIRLKQLQDEYNAAVDAQHSEQINAARQGVSTANANTKAGTLNASGNIVKFSGQAAQLVQQESEQQRLERESRDVLEKAAQDQQRESERFAENLKQSVAHWMSAQQVINIIKQGIRQAYQDIQGLDKAMTNIAVVTDMSVGELWGKINEYMSIAQQYGVTTQGVYEVSQLYYQQGLSTNEVMKATTETLKMARIAGMDYAEAADAMTVAIRAFKMEMSDAQHITDVYSKVAAVTASDTEELAIAMSKTASSAESVGSSFENTTAMLAVMIETTRESAQNLGSALKSIISRYGEMKVGLTVDSEGEEIDYNKVDTALKSVGISIKDAQGQFRDFDDVIFELSEKWDSLDKNTQRYIATIMAGNRQQSRFIALVDNWERLDEVANAAQDSEDAGLLQYSKTLDSLETKLNNIKTSFQQFYMNIINGPFIGAILEGINNILEGFNKLGTAQGIFSLVNILRGLKIGLKTIVNTFGSTFSTIVSNWKTTQSEWLNLAKISGYERGYEEGKQYAKGLKDGQTGANKQNPIISTKNGVSYSQQWKEMSWIDRRTKGTGDGSVSWLNNSWNGSKIGGLVSTGGAIAGSVLSGIGTTMAKDNARGGAWLSMLGNAASGASMGAIAGPWGAVAGAIVGIAASVPALIEAYDDLNIAQEELNKAKEEQEAANIERATKQEEVRNLESTIANLKRLQAARYKSEEAEQAFIEASNSAAEQFPQLITTYDDAGNAIIDVINQSAEAEWLLIKARKEAADATETAAAAELKTALAEKKVVEAKMNNYDENSSAAGMGNYYNNWATDILRIFDIEDGDFADNADNIQAPVDEGLAAIFAKYESGDNSIAGGLKMLVEDLRSGALDPHLERAGYTQEDFLNYIKDYINTFNLWDNNRWGGKDIDSVLDLYGDYDLLIAEQEANLAKIDAAMRAVGRSKINSLLTAEDPTETAGWRSISSAETFLSDAVLNKANLTTADFDQDGKLTAAAQTRLDQLFLKAYNDYNAFYEKLGYDLDEFNSLIQASSKGTVTKSKVIEQFEQLFGDQSTWDKIIQAYYNQIINNIEENKARIISDLNNNRISTKWATYAVEGGEFEQIIDALPAAYYTYISDFADDIDSRLKTGALTQNQTDDIISQYFNLLGKLDDSALGLTIGQLAEAQRLITEAAADGSLFSIDGIQTLITALKTADIDVSYLGLDDFPIYTVNLVTEWATLQNKLVTNLTTATEAMQKASEGMTLDEALKLAQKTGMDWSDFTFIDGKWYTSNIKAIKTYYEDEQKRIIAQLEEEKKRLLGTSDQAGTLDAGLDVKDLNTIKGLSLEEFQEEYSIEYGDNPEVWQAIQTYWDPEHYAQEAAKHVGDDSWGMTQYWEEYFNSLGQNVSAATQEALTYYAEQSEKAAKKAEFVASLNQSAKNQGVVMDKVSAYQTIASQGLLGYSAEDIASIAMAMNWQEGVQFELDKATGTYKIKEEYLSELPAEYQRQVDSLLRSETESALSSIRSLGTSLANGEVGVYADAFIKTLPDAETIIPALIKAGDYEGLKAKIAAELSARTGEEVAVNDPRVIKAANEMVAGYNDGLESNILRYIELKKKELFGTITEAEKLELDNIVDTNELSDELTGAFTNAGTTAVGKYVAIMKAAIASGANWEDVEQYIKDGYIAQLSQLASGQNFNDLGTYDIMDQVAEAEGQYSQDMLASLFAQIYAETGKEVDMSDFTQYFEIDPETKNWVLKAGANVNDFFASEYGTNVPDWIIDAFDTSEAQKQVNDAIKLDDLGASATDTIGSMMSDLTNTSLSDLIFLYESIYGEGSFAESGLLDDYQAALEAAKRGETDALITILQILTQAAIDKGADVDTAQIQSVTKDAHNTLVSGLVDSVTNGLSGTLSNVDFDKLIEQIGGAPEAYRKYVTETYDGLKLSAEGALVIASKLIDKFGNTSLVAESLVEQLGGSGALGSYKDVDDLINEIVTDTNHWAHGNEDILNLLYQMRAQYSQLAEDARFDFMNQDHFGGAADNWYTLTDNISTAIDKLKSAFEKGGKIDYKSFDNIITWISDLSVDGLDTKLGETGVTLGQFTDAVLATVDATGNLDLSAAAANLGISMDDMAGALEGGLQEVAKQQVAYWKKYLDFLKGLKKLQEAQDEVSLHIPIQNEVDGTWTYKGNTYDSWEALMAAYGGNLGMDLAAAQQFFNNFTYTGEHGTTITLSGQNNPLNFILGELDAFEPDGTLKAGMEQKIGQYIGQVFAWIGTIGEQDIDQYINEDTGEITIPWSEILQIELDTSTTPEVNTTNAGEAGEQTQEAVEGAAESALTASGATSDGNGGYTYTLDDMTLKIQMGANGSVEIDLTNATGTLPTAAELRKVFEGKPGFSATDDNNWVFTDSNLGFSIKCSNGTLSFDTSGMTPPAAPTAAELSAILGTTWTTADGGKTYTTNLNGVSFVYNSATGKININASSFQLAGGLDATSLTAILGGTWTTNDNGATYTATIAGTSFVYESSSGLVKIDGSKFTLSGGLSATELATILGGTWSSSDNGATYESTINGVTFTYKSASGTVEIDSSKFTLSAGLSTEQLTALLGGTWSTEDGITYKSVISGITFTYESTTGTISVNPSGFTVSANLTADQLKTLLGSTWTSEDGVTYKSTINGATFTYESTTGKLVVTPPTTATEPANTDFITLMQAQGWTYENGVYTKDFGGGTLTYNATAGALNITPSATMAAANPDMATLLDSAFGAGGWQPNENGGYDILNATTGEVLYTLPAKITVTPTAGSNVTSGDNGLTADVDVTLTPNTNAIDAALAAYNNQPIKISLELTNSKSSLLNSPAYNDIIAKTRAYLDKNLSYDEMQAAYYQAYNAFSPYIPSMSREDLLALQQLQSNIDFGLLINENIEDPWWTVLGEEVSAALEAFPEEGELTGITALFNSLSGENLVANLLGITSLFSTLVAPELATLDLTGFITQLQSMGELEFDDEEINAFVTAITTLTAAIAALPTEVDASVKVSAGSSYSVINDIKNALDSIKDKTVTITTKHVNSGTPTDANYAGNVSGLALAKGNATDKLLAGAHLAGKTLVGELGPELAVYNNQYHLLGRDGAEFVDLPNDAIVFNHRQTVGIIKGQAGYRGQALVSGNVTGPAAAGGIDAAIGAVEKIIKLWSNIADATVKDLVGAGGGGGGGGGSTAKAVTAELQEWYNLMRKIEYLTQEIANLESKRKNILEKEGEAYLRNLRQTQALLEEQKFAQQILVEYQQAQLERQATHINEHSIWGKFLRIDENGLLQYIDGNEDNGGKGALDVLAKLNDMNAEQQEAYVTGLGYSATDEEGKALEGADLVQKFFEDFQAQIDEYDGLYDTVHQTEEEIQSLITQAAEIEKEILENQIKLEEEIYDIIVEGFEKSIEELKEYTDLVKEANEEYVKGLKEALDAEKDMYDQNESVSDRESLQRQLSLLRRSGGSASEIADLEEQLNDSLKDEYFSNQEKMIENIEDANEEQIRKLEEQIRLQEEALEYQKENGIIWNEVYKVLDGTKAEILAFMQGNAPDFFSKSALVQKQALDDWSHKIGIFTEDRIYKSNFETADFGFENWDIWNSDSLKGLEETYNEATEEQQATGRKYFNQVYANALMEGATESEAREKANKALGEYLGRKFNDDGSYKDTDNIGQKPTQSSGEDNKLYYGGYALDGTFHGGAGKFVYGNEALAKQYATDSHTQPPIAVNKAGYFKTGSSPINPWKKWYIEDGNGNKLSATGYATKGAAEAVINKYKKIAEDNQKEIAQARAEGTTPQITPLTEKELQYTRAVAKLYSKGGLVDYTGVAIVHGSKSKPESFLNAAQTAQIKEALQATHGKENLLEGLHSTIAELRSLIHNISTINNSTNNNITVAPGAVVIQVEQLADSYDVEALSADIMNRMVAIASKATNRGVNRR